MVSYHSNKIVIKTGLKSLFKRQISCLDYKTYGCSVVVKEKHLTDKDIHRLGAKGVKIKLVYLLYLVDFKTKLPKR